MSMHRLTTPTYYGGLPVGYDYVNNGPGDPDQAAADAARIGGPNDGTYFVAFQDDATSSNANRPHKALAENTDYLDNLMRRDLALPLRTADVVAGAPVASSVLPIGSFLGAPGSTNTADSIELFIQILDSNDNEIIDPTTGTKVRVSTLTLTAPDTIGGGFAVNLVTANISPSIPTGVTYRIYYANRSNLASLPVDAFTNIKIRGAQEVPDDIEDLFRRLHGNNESWNYVPWASTIHDLALGGLDARYRKAADPSRTAPFNTPGTGAVITRDGTAPTVLTQRGTNVRNTDAIGAGWKVFMEDGDGGSQGGPPAGFVAYTPQRSLNSLSGPESPFRAAGPSFLAVRPNDHQSLLATYYTQVLQNATALATNDTITLNGGQGRWHDGAGTPRSSVATGYDMVEVTTVSSGEKKTFIISKINSQTQIKVREIDDGTFVNYGSNIPVTIRWLSSIFAIGHHAPTAAYETAASIPSDPVKLESFFFAPTGGIATNAAPLNEPTPARIFGYFSSSKPILEIGYFDELFGSGFPGYIGTTSIYANGYIDTTQLTADALITDTLVANNIQSLRYDWANASQTLNVNGTATLNLSSGSGMLRLTVGAAVTAITISISGDTDGNELAILIDLSSGAFPTLTWGGADTFSPGEGNPLLGDDYMLLRGVALGSKRFWSVTHY